MSLSSTTTTTQAGHPAIVAAEFQLDAERGAELLKSLDAKWYNEGYVAFVKGKSPASLWNPIQRRGFTAALTEALAAIEEKDAKPFLGDDRYEDEIGDISGTDGGHKRMRLVSWNSAPCAPLRADDVKDVTDALQDQSDRMNGKVRLSPVADDDDDTVDDNDGGYRNGSEIG